MVSTLFCYLQPNFRNKIEILSKKLSHVKGRGEKGHLPVQGLNVEIFKELLYLVLQFSLRKQSRCFVIKTDFRWNIAVESVLVLSFQTTGSFSWKMHNLALWPGCGGLKFIILRAFFKKNIFLECKDKWQLVINFKMLINIKNPKIQKNDILFILSFFKLFYFFERKREHK